MDSFWDWGCSPTIVFQVRSRLRDYIRLDYIKLQYLIVGLGIYLTSIMAFGIRYYAAIAVVDICLLITAKAVMQGRSRELIANRYLFIPILVIIGSILLSPCPAINKIYVLILPTVYFAGKIMGVKPISLLLPLIVIGALSTFTTLGLEHKGGIYTSYNIVTGVTIMGMALTSISIMPIIVIGLWASTAEESLFVITGLLGYLTIIRKYKVVVYTVIVTILILVITIPTGITGRMWDTTPERVENPTTYLNNGRLIPIKEALGDIELFGHGFNHPYGNLKYSGEGSIHNVPIRVLDEIGIIAALAWLWLLFYNIVRNTKYRLVWIALGLLSIFDYFLWAELWVWYWYILGATNNRHELSCNTI